VYEILLLPPAQKDLDKLEAPTFARVIKKIRALRENARPPRSLKLAGEDGYRIRAGDHRILYRIDDPGRRVFIYRVKHRKDAYS
jgi:mRNA interferase RelE/StbE